MSFAVESQIEEDVDYDKQMKKRTEEEELMQIDDGDGFQISLPIELILEFLSRLPIKSLMRLSATSKYLYNTIVQNPDFGRSHLINYSQKYPSLVLYVDCCTAENPPKLYKNFFHPWDVDDDYGNDDNHNVNVRLTIPYTSKGSYWGYCNGLVCFAKMVNKTNTFVIDVWNFTTRELVRIVSPVILHQEDTIPFKNTHLSSGFGFDSLNNEYKVVLIVLKLKTGCRQCFVYTFGTKSTWKEITLPERKRMSLVGTFTPYGGGGGALFWVTMDPRLILQFDLHQDKFQYIHIPHEIKEYPSTKDHIRLLESKGFLGVAILIRSDTNTLVKVHLKIYKDNQVWVKETFDVSPYSIPFSSNFRFISFSDQVLLYWMDHNCFQFFNLRSQCIKVVRKLTSCIWEKRLPQDATDEDYWLNCEVQNISSLRTLLHERAQKSDKASINSMMMKGIQDMLLSQDQKTFGGLGLFTSFYPSKTNQHYFYNHS